MGVGVNTSGGETLRSDASISVPSSYVMEFGLWFFNRLDNHPECVQIRSNGYNYCVWVLTLWIRHLSSPSAFRTSPMLSRDDTLRRGAVSERKVSAWEQRIHPRCRTLYMWSSPKLTLMRWCASAHNKNEKTRMKRKQTISWWRGHCMLLEGTDWIGP